MDVVGIAKKMSHRFGDFSRQCPPYKGDRTLACSASEDVLPLRSPLPVATAIALPFSPQHRRLVGLGQQV